MRAFFIMTISMQLMFSQLAWAEGETRAVSAPDLATLERQVRTQIDGLIIRHNGGSTRPDACPLESKENIDILTKINNIKALFKDNCLDADQNRLDEILAGATGIQEELDKVAAADATAGSGSGAATPVSSATLDVGGVELNGQEIANIVGNINQIYKDRSCKTLGNNQSFLEKAAGVITDFAKIGLLVPNQQALIVAGGGIALSSILLILNSLFSRRFNFEKTEDRQSFIKLNCAFYDIRKDIEKSGFLDVPTQSHRDDKGEVGDNVKKLEKKVEELNKSYEAIVKVLDDDKTAYLEEKMGVLKPLGENLIKAKAIVAKPIANVTDKLTVLRELTLLYPVLRDQINTYIVLGLGQIPVMDMMLLAELNKLDHVGRSEDYMSLINLSVGDFKNNYVASLSFHFNRLEEGTGKKKEEFAEKWAEIVRVNGKDLESYNKEIAELFQAKVKDWTTLYANLKNVNSRLDKILGSDNFSSGDDGSENIVTILSDYDTIVEQIYGKYGKRFLEYTTKKSQKENKAFVKKFRNFTGRHLIYRDNSGKEVIGVRDASQVAELDVREACQDAKPYRRMWKFSESLAQQGYDFVATNADIFHSDVPRLFLGRSNGRIGIHPFLSKFEKIRMHYKSALFAQRVLNNVPVSSDNRSDFLKKKYLGRAMLEVKYSQKYAEQLQELIEKYDCTRATQMQ